MKKDFKQLDSSQQKIALKMLENLVENPLPKNKGGYGIPLGNDFTIGNLTGLSKLKTRGFGICIVYELYEREEFS